jgi:hypothetical protein
MVLDCYLVLIAVPSRRVNNRSRFLTLNEISNLAI